MARNDWLSPSRWVFPQWIWAVTFKSAKFHQSQQKIVNGNDNGFFSFCEVGFAKEFKRWIFLKYLKNLLWFEKTIMNQEARTKIIEHEVFLSGNVPI